MVWLECQSKCTAILHCTHSNVNSTHTEFHNIEFFKQLASPIIPGIGMFPRLNTKIEYVFHGSNKTKEKRENATWCWHEPTCFFLNSMYLYWLSLFSAENLGISSLIFNCNRPLTLTFDVHDLDLMTLPLLTFDLLWNSNALC